VRLALTRKGVTAAEGWAVESLGIGLAELMERAGQAVAAEVLARSVAGSIVVFCGAGNNGGDGWVASRLLHEAGREVVVVTASEPGRVGGIAGDATLAAVESGVRWVVAPGEFPDGILDGCSVVIDSIFGIGFRVGPIASPYDAWIAAINSHDALVISVDIPSGVDADTGQAATPAVKADVTVAVIAPKVGSMLYPGAELSGEVAVRDIGVSGAGAGSLGGLELWDREEYCALLPHFGPATHKKSRGRVLIVAGSGAYPGAAILAAMGSQRSGAGYVSLVVPHSIAPIVQTRLPSVVVIPAEEEAPQVFSAGASAVIAGMACDFDAVVIGPGMTREPGATALIRELLETLDAPVVLDADGINAVVGAPHLPENRKAPTIITPHAGELARVLGVTPEEVQSDRVGQATRLAGPHLCCVLKGARTLIAAEDRLVLNLPGGVELATAGTGDVLAGIIGTFLAQGLSPLEAGALGAFAHGFAAESAAAKMTNRCVIAEDIPDFLPEAFRYLLGEYTADDGALT